MKNKIFLNIDFDGTLADKVNGTLVLKEGAKEAMQAFRNAGCYLLIDSSRANSYRKLPGTVEKSLKEMQEFLDSNQVPYDAIAGLTFKIDGKPIADFYISDKGITFNNNWQKIVNQMTGINI